MLIHPYIPLKKFTSFKVHWSGMFIFLPVYGGDRTTQGQRNKEIKMALQSCGLEIREIQSDTLPQRGWDGGLGREDEVTAFKPCHAGGSTRKSGSVSH